MNNTMLEHKNEIYIGDNLEVMQSHAFAKYVGNIKVIYIDPPYNTKSIKAYNDHLDSEDWTQFMAPRLSVSYELLREDGCIFISIDDNEYANLKIMCDKIYGKNNFVGTFITYQALRSNSKHLNTVHEYVLCYAKNKTKLKEFKVKRMDNPEDRKLIESIYKKINEIIDSSGIESAKKLIKPIISEYCTRYNITWLKNYNNVDDEGRIYFAMDLSTPSLPRTVDIPSINLYLDPLPTRGWASDEKFKELYDKSLLSYKNGRPYEKHYLEDSCDNVTSVLKFFSRNGTNDLKKLGLHNVFDTPKPVELIKFLIKIVAEDGDLVLDFFAGSGTTAQAVYELNNEKHISIKYVLIQLQESVNEKTSVYRECIAKGIRPLVSDILQYRIKTYLEINDKKIDYQLVKHVV